MNKPTFKKLCLMYMQQLTNFPYIEKDFDALSDYGLLCKVVDYLNEVIKNNNIQNESITNLYNAFITLKDYIDNYFDNLDVQEEINNKLDSMVESGELQEIIADYLNSKAIFGFDNVVSMKSSTNLINGSYAETLGYYNKNDGGSALYKIRTITNEDTVDERFIIALNDENLVAELIYKNKVKYKQLGYVSEHENENLSLEDLTFDLQGYTLDLNSYSFDNCIVKNGTIILNTNECITVTNDITFDNITFINENTTGETRNNIINTNIWSSDKVNILNCTVKNVGFHMYESKYINIKNNLFYATLDNSTSVVGSREFIHVANNDLSLENCIIEGNVFKDSKNDCIDIYPTGQNNVIKNNTFYRCKKGIELKAENRAESATDRTVYPIHSCLVQGNYFKEIPNISDVECITIYCNDDTSSDDYSKYPHIIIDSCFFSNENGVSYKGIRLNHIAKIQISNCRANKGLDVATNPGYFLYSLNSNATITNCVINNEIVDNTENGTFYVSNYIGGIIRKCKNLNLVNSQIPSFVYPTNPTSVCYMFSNVICNGDLKYKGGLINMNNSKFASITNEFTEDDTTLLTNTGIVNNCFYTGGLSANTANFTTTNCKKITFNGYISNLN